MQHKWQNTIKLGQYHYNIPKIHQYFNRNTLCCCLFSPFKSPAKVLLIWGSKSLNGKTPLGWCWSRSLKVGQDYCLVKSWILGDHFEISKVATNCKNVVVKYLYNTESSKNLLTYKLNCFSFSQHRNTSYIYIFFLNKFIWLSPHQKKVSFIVTIKKLKKIKQKIKRAKLIFAIKAKRVTSNGQSHSMTIIF